MIAYHLYMRSLLFILMIALLLLRGWTGDAMATGMALAPVQHQQIATKTVANHIQAMVAEEHFGHEAAVPVAVPEVQAVDDCAGHAPDDPSHAANAHCESCAACQACQACQAVALTPSAGDSNPVSSSRILSRPGAAPFSSAVAARDQKPPIS